MVGVITHYMYIIGLNLYNNGAFKFKMNVENELASAILTLEITEVH